MAKIFHGHELDFIFERLFLLDMQSLLIIPNLNTLTKRFYLNARPEKHHNLHRTALNNLVNPDL